jgi:hypothetical protein
MVARPIDFEHQQRRSCGDAGAGAHECISGTYARAGAAQTASSATTLSNLSRSWQPSRASCRVLSRNSQAKWDKAVVLLRDFKTEPSARRATRGSLREKAVHGPPARKERLSAIERRHNGRDLRRQSKIQRAKKTDISANIAAKPRFGVSQSPPRGTI